MNLVFYVLQQLVNALSIGSLYALMAVGLAMVFSQFEIPLMSDSTLALGFLAGVVLPDRRPEAGSHPPVLGLISWPIDRRWAAESRAPISGARPANPSFTLRSCRAAEVMVAQKRTGLVGAIEGPSWLVFSIQGNSGLLKGRLSILRQL